MNLVKVGRCSQQRKHPRGIVYPCTDKTICIFYLTHSLTLPYQSTLWILSTLLPFKYYSNHPAVLFFHLLASNSHLVSNRSYIPIVLLFRRPLIVRHILLANAASIYFSLTALNILFIYLFFFKIFFSVCINALACFSN